MDVPTPLRARLRQLVLEAHRRSLWQVVGLYAAASWIAYEVVLGLTEGLGLPLWVPGTTLVLLITGLPVVLATAFVQEGSRDGSSPMADPEPGLAGGPAPGQGALEAAGRRHFTWRRVGLLGVGSFAVLVLMASGYMGMRVFGIGPVGTLVARGEMAPRDALVVADFQGLTGESSLALVVAEALRADLAQSGFVSLADRARVREVLKLMLAPPDAPLDAITAREVAVRLGLKAVVEGEVARAGPGFLLSARVVTADSGRTLATFRETAADSTGLLSAIEGLSRALRERVGESLRDVRASPPLAQVTTSSLPALRKAVEATREELRGNRPRAMRLLAEAVALDSSFSAAWASLAVLHYNSGNRSATLEAIRRALEHEDRLDERQRHRVRGLYGSITGDYRTAMTEQTELAALDPGDPTPHVLLSDAAWNLGEWAAAEAHARRSLELGATTWVAHWNLVVALLDGGDLAGASRAAEAAAAALPPGHDIPRQLADLALAAAGRYDSIHARNADVPFRAAFADRVLGRWAEAEEHGREGDFAGRARALRAVDRVLLLGDTAAIDQLEALAGPGADAGNGGSERRLAELAVVLAMAGRPEPARRMRDAYLEHVPPDVRGGDAFLLHSIDAFLALHAHRGDEAVAGLRRARDSTRWTAPVDAFLGRAFDVLGRPDSAIVAYERYLATPWSDRIGFFNSFSDPLLLVPVHERLAFLYDETGDPTGAARHAAAVAGLWRDADPELQPRVAAMRRILARTVAEPGP